MPGIPAEIPKSARNLTTTTRCTITPLNTQDGIKQTLSLPMQRLGTILARALDKVKLGRRCVCAINKSIQAQNQKSSDETDME
jgi:hypothetical protein